MKQQRLKILIISDSHGEDWWTEILNNYDFTIHAGDHLLGSKIEDYVDFYVDGNNDWGHKHFNEFKILNTNFLLIHGDEQNLRGNNETNIISKLTPLINAKKYDIIIFGHTHIPFASKVNKTIILNPGSASFSRHDGKKYYLELLLSNNGICDLNFKKYEK